MVVKSADAWNSIVAIFKLDTQPSQKVVKQWHSWLVHPRKYLHPRLFILKKMMMLLTNFTGAQVRTTWTNSSKLALIIIFYHFLLVESMSHPVREFQIYLNHFIYISLFHRSFPRLELVRWSHANKVGLLMQGWMYMGCKTWKSQVIILPILLEEFVTYYLIDPSYSDCSIAPGNVGANTYNTAIAIGEKAAVIIAEDLGIKGVTSEWTWGLELELEAWNLKAHRLNARNM